MTIGLSRQYLENHIKSNDEGLPAYQEQLREVALFGDQVFDAALRAALENFPDGAERESLSVQLPIQIRPVDNSGGIESGCVEVCVGFPPVQFCYHRDFKGDRPGKG